MHGKSLITGDPLSGLLWSLGGRERGFGEGLARIYGEGL